MEECSIYLLMVLRSITRLLTSKLALDQPTPMAAAEPFEVAGRFSPRDIAEAVIGNIDIVDCAVFDETAIACVLLLRTGKTNVMNIIIYN
jgi:hypothetical protein